MKILFSVTTIFLCFFFGFSQNWKKVTSFDCKFTTYFPGEVDTELTEDELGTSYVFETTYEDIVFMVNSIIHKTDLVEENISELELANTSLKAVVEEMGGVITKDKIFIINNHQGKHAIFYNAENDFIVNYKVVIIGQIQYQIMTLSTSENLNSELLDKFFESFKIVEKSGDSPQDDKNIQENQKNKWKGNGSGFFVDKTGYIATNYHVVRDAIEIQVDFVIGGLKQSFTAKVIQTDKINDLAIIKIMDDNFKPLRNLPYNFITETVDVGTKVFALGYPMALSVMGAEIKFTDGRVSSRTGYQGDVTKYQTTTPLQPGNSGGPLFDFDGNIIGVNSGGISHDIADNVSYSIKSNYLKQLIDVLDYDIILPNDKTISVKSLTEKIKILSDYVVLIKVK